MSRIRIKQSSFSFPDHFALGHRLSQAEAQALNSLLAENVRNNTARWVADAYAELPDGAMLPDAAHARLQAKIAEYARDYHFADRAQVPRATALELETHAVAEERVRARWRAGGETPEGPEFLAMVEAEEGLPAIAALARERVATRQRIAARALEELL